MKDLSKITNLVLKGGGVKGVAYVGAIFALASAGLNLNQIQNVAGTSAGAIMAMLLSIGYGPEALLEVLTKTPFSSFLDDGGLTTSSSLLKTSNKLADEKPGATIPAITIFPILATRLGQQYGIFEGEKIRQWFEEKLFGATKIKHITFQELHQLRAQAGYQHFKDLYVIGFNINESRTTVFSYQETPDVIIADALRASMSIPYVFKPHFIYKKVAGDRRVAEENDMYVDGGLTDNYPIRIFDETHPVENTLGLNLVAEDKFDFYAGETNVVPRNTVQSFLNFNQTLLSGLRKHQDWLYLNSAQDCERSIHISDANVGTLDFNLILPDQQKLLRSGWDGVCNYVHELELNMPETLRAYLEDIIMAANVKKYIASETNPDDILARDNWCLVNIWTSAEHPTLPGTNVGHVSLQTKDDYMSLWPNNDFISGKSDYAPHFFRRYYRQRGSDFKLSYEDDVKAERDVHANVRIVIYGLNLEKMKHQFETCKRHTKTWRLIGSNMLERVAGSGSENCASTAYQLLVAGGMYDHFSSKGSKMRSEVSAVVKPDDLLPHVVAAKRRELERFPQSRHWHHVAETTIEGIIEAIDQQSIVCTIS